MKTGICGTGKMGSAIAEWLVDLGHEVVVWNRTAKKAQALLGPRINAADTPAQLALQVETVICMVLDMSTVKPSAARDVAQRVNATGALFVDCPVGGTVTPARSGKLLGLAGGDEDAFARAKPLLEQLCRRVEHVGPVGTGSAMKLAVNLPLAVCWAALGEALSLACASGIDAELAGDILGDSSGAATVAKVRIPAVIAAIRGEMPAMSAFNLDAMAKDLRLMQEHADALGFTVPTTAAACGAYDMAVADGWAEHDATLQAAWKCRQGTQG